MANMTPLLHTHSLVGTLGKPKTETRARQGSRSQRTPPRISLLLKLSIFNILLGSLKVPLI